MKKTVQGSRRDFQVGAPRTSIWGHPLTTAAQAGEALGLKPV